MTPEDVQNVAPEPAGMNAFSRLTGVIFEPKKTFDDIARRPTFLVPMVLVIVFAIGFIALFSQRVGWERMIREQTESSSRAQQMTAEQKEQSIAMGVKFAPIFGYVGTIVGVPVADLAVAGILLGIAAGMMSAPIKFKQVFAVVCWSYVPTLISTVLAIVVMFLKNPEDFNLKNPLVFNPGAFLEPDMPSKFIYSLATSLDLFVLWIILLMATGLKAAGGKRFSFGSALTAVVLPWGVYVLGKSAVAAIF
jgi:hypothetical protein